MKYLIAVDGGGTKTESILFTEDGTILGRDVTQGVNALDVGIDTAKERLLGAVRRLQQKIPGGHRPDSLYGGLAACVDYYPDVMVSFLRENVDCPAIRLEGDGGNLIAAMQGHADGASLIAGTGSALFIRSGEALHRYGGWGPTIDTEGSGYKLGLHAFYSAFRSLDGRGPETVLYDLIAEQMGAKPENCLPDIYAKGRPYISTFARCVFAGRKMGDAVATGIFNHGVKCLSELVELGDNVLQKKFNVYTGGGLFSAFPEYLEALRLAVPANATLIPLDTQPVYGAAVEALWNIGIVPGDDFKSGFISRYEEIVSYQDTVCGGNSSDFKAIYCRA